MEGYRPFADDLNGTRQHCGNCVFWLEGTTRGKGACRRNAPRVVGEGVALQPETVENLGWCGEWERREVPEFVEG